MAGLQARKALNVVDDLIKVFSTQNERLRFLKFCAVGFSGVLVNMAIFALCAEVFFFSMDQGTRNLLATSCAVVVSIFTNFFLNDGWTWRDRRRQGGRALLMRMTKYYIVAAMAGGVQIAIQFLLSIEMGLNAHLANFAGIGAGVLINFFVNNLWTFRPETSEPDTGKGDSLTHPRMAQVNDGMAPH